ncbi:hypothetical protein SLEP1_g33506 [Rubroshorea leprosula]|uniref:Uncharacterized protein n=1 Tax=Rubroshorea leprosula TaxID=152421 RepID=A0AAV5KGT9_9ROSI|nr:hypothetical protein SLEP1_g33506 [Rubroshorea leprosula]
MNEEEVREEATYVCILACSNQALLSTTIHNGQQLPYHNPYQAQNHNPNPFYEEDSSSWMSNLADPTMTQFHHPVVGMFGEMVYARVFGNSESLYTYPNSYYLMGNSSPKLRRQEMQADKSLNRISIFLFCCFLLCLIVF